MYSSQTLRFHTMPVYCLLLTSVIFSSFAIASTNLDEIITAKHRADANIIRNQARHPQQTLNFFGIEPSQTVLEVWPGGGWYTEILAPYLKDTGKLYLAHFSPKHELPFYQSSLTSFKDKLSAHPLIYDRTILTALHPSVNEIRPAPENSVDLVLTFRNVHNWTKAGFDQKMFDAFYTVTKPGGMLGVVEHRAAPGTSIEDMIKSGYMTESYVQALAQSSGFILVKKSEINANPKDTKNHPNGVWSLPPSLRGGEEAKYRAIGESDRMTLLFKKP